MNFGKQFLASLLGSTVALLAAGTLLIFIFVGALVGGLSSAFAEAGDDIESEFDFGVDIEEGSVLHLTFDAPFVERGMEVPSFSFSFGGVDAESQTGLNHFLADMERAAQDDRIEGILIQADMVMGYQSMLGEVRDALVGFKESGKWIIAWSEVYTQSAYWISTVADEVYLHPEGQIDMRGMGMETMFYKRMLEDVGIEMTIVRGPDNKYKSAVEPFFRENLSEANREQNMALLEDFWARMGGDIATARDKSIAELDGEINALAMRTTQDFLDLGYVDGLLYEDELHAMLLDKGAAEDEDEESHAQFVSLKQYHNPDFFEDFITTLQEEMKGGNDDDEDEDDEDSEETEANAVAVVFAVGAIESGQGDDATIGSERIAGALREARLDPEVGAVVLRVNSPGGSALASDVIWRETVLLKEAGKPVVASMSDLAASGGYYISCAADHILAQPNTITGSIGVFGVLPSAGKLMRERIGLDFDGVKIHEHADALNGHTPVQGEALAAINEGVTQVYDAFIARVAEGRGMTVEGVNEVARGRVWTGQDAMDIGLVDGMGNLQDAVALAADLAGINGPELVELPEAVDPFEQFIEDFAGVQAAVAIAEAAGLDGDLVAPLLEVEALVHAAPQDRIQARMPYTIRLY